MLEWPWGVVHVLARAACPRTCYGKLTHKVHSDNANTKVHVTIYSMVLYMCLRVHVVISLEYMLCLIILQHHSTLLPVMSFGVVYN